MGQPLQPGNQIETIDDCQWTNSDLTASVDVTVSDWASIKNDAISPTSWPCARARWAASDSRRLPGSTRLMGTGVEQFDESGFAEAGERRCLCPLEDGLVGDGELSAGSD